MKTIGQKIKSLRIALGLSREQLSEIIEVTHKSIYRYETGKSLPDTTALVKLATYFDVSTDYLLTGTEKSSPTENLSENELEMLEVFQKFNEREQLKLIGKLEELYRQKQIKENQKTVAIKIARSSDGKFRKTELTAEELERIENLPEDTDF
mgnify:CR=1 FL=1